jgi:hypothetical protein
MVKVAWPLPMPSSLTCRFCLLKFLNRIWKYFSPSEFTMESMSVALCTRTCCVDPPRSRGRAGG